MLAKKEQIE